ncbi:MAG: FAD-binding protein [Saprospiraceae bacterium]|nr:FAD-binding protein [Saprospiraceae bacterium]
MATIQIPKGFQVFIQELNTISTSEIKTDDLSLGLYATDASLYQLQPLAVAIPSHESDLIKIIQIANKYNIPVMPRGSATSLAGQTTNQTLIIDFTKYFDKILAINPEERYAIVQPGVVRDQLNAALKSHNLHYAPDPATSSRATIGGMIANNSSGTKSIKYGKTIDHVLELKVLLMDGTVLELGELSAEAYETKCQQIDREGEIYRSFRKIIFEHATAIEAAYPKVMRRVNGYPLDEYIHTDRWNMAKIFAGSEGSLGIILQAKVNLEPIPKYKAAFTVHYDDRMRAIREVYQMIAFDPAAIEMLDFIVFEQSVKNNMTKGLHQRLIVGTPQATLSVEFFCLSQEELDQRITEFSDWLKDNSTAYAYPILRTAAELDDSWALRKNGLGLIMGDPSGRKPIPFIEDQAIPVENLADYIEDILKICKKYDVETILYAHASVGVLHVRPGLDVTKQEDIDLMKKISDDVFQLVKKYKGAWSGEHGDGRNRGHRLRDFFGDEVYQCLKDVKTIFDPEYLLNPGIIIDVPPMDQHLRYGAGYKDKKYDFVYKYRKDHSFEALVHNCSGVGACRNHIGGTMCPSFKGTADEDASTRGRANALRLAISGQLGFEGLTDPKVLETLDLCLSCKACKSECPSNVDLAKLKSEVLQKKYDEGKITFREKAISSNVNMVPIMAGWKAPFVNFVQGTAIFKYAAEKILKVDRRRTLPSYANESLETWYKNNYKSNGSKNKVALFADTYINYHEPQVGKAAIKLLTDCGYEVLLASVGCCQRPRISNGFLKEAKSDGTQVAEKLLPYINQGMKVVVCEPSCTSALTDDLPDLIEDIALSDALKTHVMTIDVFLSDALSSGQLKGKFVAKSQDILLHGHCHQKASFGTSGMKSIYKSSSTNCHEPDSGCCGMAGSFGYESEHYYVSKKISELVLVPAINKTDKNTLVVANGFSCRHQIHDFAGRKAVHWVESVEYVHTL